MEKKTILVVDDEDIICDLLAKILANLGYNAILAKNGRQAVEIYSLQHNDIDLAIVDLSMPELDGRQTLIKLKEINSDLIVLLSSGHYEHSEVAPDQSSGIDGFLIKPYRVSQLEKVIGKVLNDHRPASRPVRA